MIDPTKHTRQIAVQAGKVCPQCGTQCQLDAQYCHHCGFPISAVATCSDDPMIGRSLPGGYQVLSLVGIGGMGRVYRAEQRTLGRTVAVKVIHPHLLSDEKSLSRFFAEARTTSQLNHPNIVSVIDFGKLDDGKPYLVMEFLRGNNLAHVCGIDGPFPLQRIVRVLKQVLAALEEAHDLGVIHRDLKPENIVLEPMRRGGDFVKVVDFGLAKLHAETTGITLPGLVCGTPDFMAPEQGRGDTLDGRADLYAVGVVLFWLLTGRLPFESESPTQVVLMHIGSPVPDPRNTAPQRNISEAIVRVVHRALAKTPIDRFQNANEFAEALDASISPSDRATPSVTRVYDEISECPNCHGRVPRGKFCLECGLALPSASVVPKSVRGRKRLALLGRDEDLQWLSDALQTPGTVRVVGEHGVGKSRLLAESLHRADAAGYVTVHAGPDPYGAEVAGHALRVVIGNLLTAAPLQAGNPLLKRWAELQSGNGSGSPAEKRRGYVELLVAAISARLALGRPRGLVIALDDLNRIDGLTRIVINDYVALAHGNAVILATHIPSFSQNWPGERVRLLAGLSARHATELLQRSGNRGAAGIALTEVGNRGIPPLYVEQVLAFGVDGGSDPPARLADLLAQRIATLEPELRRVVQAIAVLGEEVPVPRIAALLQQDVDPSFLKGLVDAQILCTQGVDKYSLVHPLFRDLALHTTPAAVRQELHTRALVLFENEAAPLEVLTEHAVLAQDSLTALFLIEQLAARAKSCADFETESFVLRRGLEIARQELYRGQLDDPLRAIGIFSRRLGQALVALGQFSDAEGVLLEALESTEERSPERIEVLKILAETAQQRQRFGDAERYLSQALRATDISKDATLAASLRGELTRLRSRSA